MPHIDSSVNTVNTGGVATKHPDYVRFEEDWQQLTDTFLGERHVKSKGTDYLPATSGQIKDGQVDGKEPGNTAYKNYKLRAVYHDFFADAVRTLVGLMHKEPPVIELPARLEPLLEQATINGESAAMLLRRINEGQLKHGRYGLLVEAPDGEGANAMPFIAPYAAQRIINWDVGVREQGRERVELIVIDESEFERQANLNWEFIQKWRVLSLTDVIASAGEFAQQAPASGLYSVAVVRENQNATVGGLEFMQPQIAGTTLDNIPFVFVNSIDMNPTPDVPPLLGLSNLTLTIYRGEADYRQALYLQGQDTLVRIGVSRNAKDKLEVGAGAVIDLPLGGKAEYIGPTSDGISEMREALSSDKTQARQQSGSLLDDRSRQRESGEALQTRMAARTATLQLIAETGAEALANSFKIAARWVGADPDEVVVTPNMDFIKEEFVFKALSDLMDAKLKGAPLSTASIHQILQERGLTELTFEEEQEAIEKEAMDDAAGESRLDLDPSGGTPPPPDPDAE